MKIGVMGVGHLGKIHLKCLQETDWDIVGVYDPDPKACQEAAEHYGVAVYDSVDTLLDKVDAVDIVSTTISHYEVAISALQKGKHVFIEKPIADTVPHAKEIVDLAEKKNLKVQVGHVERYNPAMKALDGKNVQPKFVEAHRLTTFNTRGNDVSVVYDLMIHDIDLVLSLIGSTVRMVQANGVCVVNDTPDICNARITFENNAVANITASRISMKNMRKIRLFQKDEYLSIDLLKKETQIVSLSLAESDFDGLTLETSAGKKRINIEVPNITETNAIQEELSDFYQSIKEDTPTYVSGNDGLQAMILADMIEAKCHEHLHDLSAENDHLGNTDKS